MPGTSDASTPVANWLKREYGRIVDPNWLRTTIDQIQASSTAKLNTQALIHAVRDAFLSADLGVTTLPEPPCLPVPSDFEFDTDVGGTQFDGTYFDQGQGCLVQIVRIQEVGVSAFSLQTTADARKEALSGATRIRSIRYRPTGGADGDDGDDEEEEVDVDGVPPYQRSMLLLDVSDGVTTMRAMELRRMGELQLGVTELGCKLLLKNIRVRRGILQLTPDSCVVKGGCVEWLEAGQGLDFRNGLRARMGKPPLQDQPEAVEGRDSQADRLTVINGATGPSNGRPASRSAQQDAASDYSDEDFPIDFDAMQDEANLNNAEAGPSRPRATRANIAVDEDFSFDEPGEDEIQAMLEAENQAAGGSHQHRSISTSKAVGLVDVETKQRRKQQGRELARQYRLDEDAATIDSSPPNEENTSRFFSTTSRRIASPPAQQVDSKPDHFDQCPDATVDDVDMLYPDDEDSEKENKPPPPPRKKRSNNHRSPDQGEREVIEISD